jgi:hypothetical protein
VQEICTLGSAWGDEFKKPRSLGEGTGVKASDNSEAPQRATASRLVSTILRDHLILRTEAASNNVNDYGVKKAVENLPVLQNSLSAINDTYLNVQQDILETFVDRDQLRKLAEPTVHRPESAFRASSSITPGNLH